MVGVDLGNDRLGVRVTGACGVLKGLMTMMVQPTRVSVHPSFPRADTEQCLHLVDAFMGMSPARDSLTLFNNLPALRTQRNVPALHPRLRPANRACFLHRRPFL